MKNALVEFIKEKTGYLVTDFSLGFDVEVGIDGLDAEIFFEEFSNYFDIDMSSFDYSRYFNEEVFRFKDFFSKKFKFFKVKRHFSFNHLLEVIEVKKWFDPN